MAQNNPFLVLSDHKNLICQKVSELIADTIQQIDNFKLKRSVAYFVFAIVLFKKIFT